MFQISMDQGFQILQAYLRNGSRLHVLGLIGGERAWSAAKIAEATPTNFKFELFDDAGGPHWICDVPLSGASIWFDPLGDSARLSGGASDCRSALRLAYDDGTELILGEGATTVQ